MGGWFSLSGTLLVSCMTLVGRVVLQRRLISFIGGETAEHVGVR